MGENADHIPKSQLLSEPVSEPLSELYTLVFSLGYTLVFSLVSSSASFKEYSFLPARCQAVWMFNTDYS
jgi:hypothetical protein